MSAEVYGRVMCTYRYIVRICDMHLEFIALQSHMEK